MSDCIDHIGLTAAPGGIVEAGVPPVAPSQETSAGRRDQHGQRTGDLWGVVVAGITEEIGEEVVVEEEEAEAAEENGNSAGQELDDEELPGKLCAT